jgi:hypothetical protein
MGRGGGMRRRAARAALAALAVVTLIAGCAQIPRSGTVNRVGPITQQNDGLGSVDFLPSGPAHGATQDEILRGFIQAAVAPGGDYQVAREFLASSFATRWNPDASVTVDTGTSSTSSQGDDEKVLTIMPVAFVDADGNYRQAESSSAIRQQYSFVKEKGQWRISEAPGGVVIDSSRFTDVFSPHSLYFFSPDLGYLVPDQRWFPNSPASLQTRIAKELVQGPAGWLSGAYVSAFPQGSALTADSVTITGGIADVDLNSAAGAADALTLARMQLQLSASLASVAGITNVRISIDGVQRPVSSTLQPAPEQNPQVGTDPLVMRAGKFGFLTGSTVAEIPGISGKVEELGATAATLTGDQRTAAVLTPGGVFAVHSTQDAPVQVDVRHGVVAPTADPSGNVWSASSSDPDSLMVAAPSGDVVALAVTWPGAQSLSGIAMSRDGTRLAALVQTPGGTHIMVAGVVRAADGRPQSLNPPIDLGMIAGVSSSIAWIDEVTVAVLVPGSAGDSSIEVQSVGGQSQTQTGPAAGLELGPVGEAPTYWVLSAGGSLQWAHGTGWQQRIDDVQFIGQQIGKSG